MSYFLFSITLKLSSFNNIVLKLTVLVERDRVGGEIDTSRTHGSCYLITLKLVKCLRILYSNVRYTVILNEIVITVRVTKWCETEWYLLTVKITILLA